MEIAKERGDEILRAVEQFYDANGRAPEKLESLVPQYIAEIKNTSLGCLGGYKFGYAPQYFLGTKNLAVIGFETGWSSKLRRRADGEWTNDSDYNKK